MISWRQKRKFPQICAVLNNLCWFGLQSSQSCLLPGKQVPASTRPCTLCLQTFYIVSKSQSTVAFLFQMQDFADLLCSKRLWISSLGTTENFWLGWYIPLAMESKKTANCLLSPPLPQCGCLPIGERTVGPQVPKGQAFSEKNKEGEAGSYASLALRLWVGPPSTVTVCPMGRCKKDHAYALHKRMWACGDRLICRIHLGQYTSQTNWQLHCFSPGILPCF